MIERPKATAFLGSFDEGGPVGSSTRGASRSMMGRSGRCPRMSGPPMGWAWRLNKGRIRRFTNPGLTHTWVRRSRFLIGERSPTGRHESVFMDVAGAV